MSRALAAFGVGEGGAQGVRVRAFAQWATSLDDVEQLTATARQALAREARVS
jgi:hypothetical protein